MSNQGTIRLKVTNGAPAIEKLWNGRFKLEFLCDNNSPKEDWYYDNISSILPDYGILQETNFGSGVSEDWEAIPSSVYPDMRLVETEYLYIPAMGDKRVKLTYETLTDSWVEEKSEDTDYELNGLKRVSRTFVALPGTTYDKVVGTNTINSDGTTLYLGSFKIEKTEAKWKLTEVWLEAGTLSETLDNVGSQKAKVIETIGADPATPSGYSLASKQESNLEGFQTNRFTFLKNNVELSRSEDKVGSQLAITTEVFNPTSDPTEAGYSIANEQESDVDGIPTKRFTFLKDNVVLSESEDKVGSQLAIVKEVFNGTPTTPAGYLLANTQKSDVEGIPTSRYTFLKPSVLSESTDNVGSQEAKVIETFSETPVTPTGYSLANTQVSDFEGIKTNRYTFLKDNVELSRSEDRVGSQLAITTQVFNPTSDPTEAGYSVARKEVSDVDGIPTKRFTFLKPSILSLQQEFVGGATTVQVSAFGMTESQVDADLSEVTASHILISQSEGDYEGISTRQFTYEVDDFEERDRVGNDLLRIQETELSASPFADGDVGTTTKLDGGTTLYLGSENIDNGNNVKRRIRIWMEAGTLNISTATESTGLNRVSTTFLHIEGTTNGPIVSRSEQNVLGLKTITVSTLERSDGLSITNETPTNTFGAMFNFTYPGVVGASSVTTTSVQNGVVADSAVNRFFYQSSPVERPIPATSYVFFQLSSLPVTADYVYGGASGLWSPSEWAGGIYYGWRYQRDNFGTPIGERPSFRGFRAVENDSEVASVFTSLTGTATDDDGLSGTLLLNGTTFEISVSGGPEKPDGNTYTLGTIDIEPAFIDEDGVQYYKKVITVATIPTQGGSVIT
jgi:hypothetical protein